MQGPLWTIADGDSPLLASAIHAGHAVRADVAERLRLPGEVRRREEDAFTELFTVITPSRILVHRSRFELDLNRPRELAVYRGPEHAWGLEVWRAPLDDALVAHSLQLYDAFYSQLRAHLETVVARFGRFVLLDIHSYNHRREGPDAGIAPPAENPEINVGTGSLDHARWQTVVSRFMHAVGEGPSGTERRFDVRENVRFQGGELSRWVHRNFPETGCVLSIEIKKFYVDEWTDELDEEATQVVTEALAAAVPELLEVLEG